MADRDFEAEAAALAGQLREIFNHFDVEVIAAGVVEALAPIAHQRRESIISSYIDPARKMRVLVSADCVCVDCVKVGRLSTAQADLL